MRRLAPVLAVGAALAGLLHASPAAAAVERFAILIGNDTGQRDEVTLRFAETDAVKMRDVLVDLGDFRAENVTLLQGQSAAAARRAIITVNDRIRSLSAGTDAVLLVYYSGHADAGALHLGDTDFEMAELERLVRGSAAGVRLLIVDACRSGALTRVKGARPAAEFQIRLDERLAAQGAIFLTSSAANEDAQESDELRGSFFTHYLVSGLLGAADASGDGQVSLVEAYRHAYENTLRASSRTLAGTQHPTFQFDLSGRGDVVLTRLAGAPGRRGWLRFPAGRAYLVLAHGPDGTVVAEVGARDRHRRLSVRPGRYFVRGRGSDHLLEGMVTVAGAVDHEVADGELQRIEFARLVRKGGGVLDRVHGPELGARLHGAIDNADRLCAGAFAGYQVDTPALHLGARLGWCRSGYDNEVLEATTDEAALSIRVAHVWDLPIVSVGPLAALGGGVFRQRFTTRGEAPARTTLFGTFGLGLVASRELPGGLALTLDVLAETFAFRQRAEGGDLDGSLAVGADLSVGWRF